MESNNNINFLPQSLPDSNILGNVSVTYLDKTNSKKIIFIGNTYMNESLMKYLHGPELYVKQNSIYFLCTKVNMKAQEAAIIEYTNMPEFKAIYRNRCEKITTTNKVSLFRFYN
jgi:hypothetical protein